MSRYSLVFFLLILQSIVGSLLQSQLDTPNYDGSLTTLSTKIGYLLSTLILFSAACIALSDKRLHNIRLVFFDFRRPLLLLFSLYYSYSFLIAFFSPEVQTGFNLSIRGLSFIVLAYFFANYWIRSSIFTSKSVAIHIIVLTLVTSIKPLLDLFFSRGLGVIYLVGVGGSFNSLLILSLIFLIPVASFGISSSLRLFLARIIGSSLFIALAFLYNSLSSFLVFFLVCFILYFLSSRSLVSYFIPFSVVMLSIIVFLIFMPPDFIYGLSNFQIFRKDIPPLCLELVVLILLVNVSTTVFHIL